MKIARCLMSVLLGALVSFGATAQTYPSRPVKLIVPFAAGGAVDILGRIVANALTAATGQSFIVDNKPGAGGLLAMDAVAKAAPDGYTLGVGSTGTPEERLLCKRAWEDTIGSRQHKVMEEDRVICESLGDLAESREEEFLLSADQDLIKVRAMFADAFIQQSNGNRIYHARESLVFPF